MKIDALIFDFDGTLAELNIDFTAMYAEVRTLAREMGLAGPWPEGLLLEVIEDLRGELGDPFVERAHELLRAREEAAARQGRLFPYTEALLGRARGLGLGTAIISRNCGQAIRVVFPGIDGACDLFLPREKVNRVKPHPEHVNVALDGLGTEPGRAAVVGDHPIDVTGARAAGCLAVGVTSGRMSAGDLAAAGADLVLPHAGGLLKALGIDGEG